MMSRGSGRSSASALHEALFSLHAAVCWSIVEGGVEGREMLKRTRLPRAPDAARDGSRFPP